jgi:cell pole-organizing protein PopZ
MAQANVAHEPTMEEILASIRQIISEDGAASPSGGQVHQGGAERPREQHLSEPHHERPPQPQQRPAQAPQAAARPAADPHAAAARPQEPRPQAAPRQQATPERPLLSSDSNASVAHSFNTLTHTILAQNARTLEDLVGEMLRPMLREWLDSHLPGIVERQVRQEIERISRQR